MKEEISVVIPVYNERRVVKSTIEKIKEVMKGSKQTYEIIAVDDCSSDNSFEILNKIKDIKTLHNNSNKGYGASLKKGIKEAKGEWILIIDADGTYPIHSIPELIKNSENYDMVVGARIGSNVNIPLLRQPAKWFLNKFSSYIASYKIPDLNSGLRLFKKEIALKYWNLFPDKFSFTSTITMVCLTNGYEVKYIPIDYYKRSGKSTIHPIKDTINFTALLLKLALFFRPMKVFLPISLFMTLFGIGILIWEIIYLKNITDSVLLLIISGIQMGLIGIIGEVMIRKH